MNIVYTYSKILEFFYEISEWINAAIILILQFFVLLAD